MACTLGDLLPLQLLYEGTADRCHPQSVTFPVAWDIFHTESHWSNSKSVARFVETVLRTWAERQQERNDLPPDQKALLILDVFKAHRTPEVLKAFNDAGWKVLFVLANCTSELQPLDLRVNAQIKAALSDCFTKWYSGSVSKALKEHDNDIEKAVEAVRPDLRLSVVKPLHARWVQTAFWKVQEKRSAVTTG